MSVFRVAAVAICLAITGSLHAEQQPAPDPLIPRIAALWSNKTTPETPQTPHPAVVRVIATDRNSLSLGSGTLVDSNDDYGLVITNWHVVRDAVGQIEVVFPDGFHSPARVVRTDKEWDLASLLIWKPSVVPVPISTIAPKPGDPLTIAGYGKGNYKMQSGACTQYLAPAPGRPSEIVELSAAARHGDSGGPILNSRGELAGVLFGEGGGRTDGSYGGRVHQFLQLTAMDLQKLPPSNIANPASKKPADENRSPEAIARAAPSAQFAGGIASADEEERRWPANESQLETPNSRIASSQRGPETKPLYIGGPAPTNSNDNNEAPRDSFVTAKPHGFWHAWGGEIKSLLAIFGAAAIGLQFLRLFSGK
jgi:hypothetical protein